MKTAALALATTLVLWGGPGRPDPSWREFRYSGRTRYVVLQTGEGPVLRAESHDQNSALLRRLDMDPRGVTVSWRWRVLEHPNGADPEVRARDDRAAAVVVVLQRRFPPWRTRALLYQWTPRRPRGEWSRSRYSREVRTLVIENAPADTIWRQVSRDLGADLAQAFGAVPARIEAIGVVCDTDNTGGRARAEFGELRLDRRDAAQ